MVTRFWTMGQETAGLVRGMDFAGLRSRIQALCEAG